MPADDRLDSWKEIAAYLGREVRTVQLWEKSEGLPIHRQQHARQGSVYAFKSELDVWREARKTAHVEKFPRRPIALAGSTAALILIAVGGWLYAREHRAPLTSVVVLPFVDFSPQHDQEYFSDGLTEEIIDALSRVPNLRVVARTSAFAFKGKPNDVREIGKQLDVSAVLEGSVRKAGDQLRITAQLNRASDGTHLWSRTYDRQMRDIFAVQREISQAIAEQLRAGDIPLHEQTRDVEAWRLYQEGRYFFNQFLPPESNLKAIDRYQQAVQRDPKFALAYAGMADAYAYLAENFVVAPREVMPKAKAAAEKAVELDPNSAEAHTSLGAVKLDYDWDREGAQRELKRAMQLNPGFAWARHWYAHALESQNRMEDALQEMRAALALDPLNIPINWDIGNELICLGRFDEAVRHLRKAYDLFPKVPTIGLVLVAALNRTGDVAGANRIVDEMKKNSPELNQDPSLMAFFALAEVNSGHRSEGRRVLDELEQIRKKQYVDPFSVLELCAALNDEKNLHLWLKRMEEERSTIYVYLDVFMRAYVQDTLAKAKNRER
ncbi:MAG TPA: tetratricopeptide repeat protein [Bryobacteraceae bacterium]|nr:tetratricopeptide repeat protein [Bryobacteraceae bacterium]